MPIHPTASEGFGRAAPAYERGRPGYPQEAIDWMVTALGLGPGSRVIDLGAGTGKFSRMLAPTGARIIAIEPVAGMRAEFARALPGIKVLDGTAETIPAPDGSADAVTAAQAFHWFAGSQSLAEIRRVLRPGGMLGLIWNRRDERDPLQAAIGGIVRPYREGAPSHERDGWREVMRTTTAFVPVAERQFSHRQLVDADGLVDRVVSISFIATLKNSERELVAERIRRLATGMNQLTLPYLSDVFLYRRS
jgi:SAM-dependent methyltransferase